MGIFGNLFGGNDDDGDDDDRPVAPWQNVSQEEVPVTLVTGDDDTDTWETKGGNLIQTWPFVDQGDD
jgi:hypothetical protein